MKVEHMHKLYSVAAITVMAAGLTVLSGSNALANGEADASSQNQLVRGDYLLRKVSLYMRMSRSDADALAAERAKHEQAVELSDAHLERLRENKTSLEKALENR
jgi:hypothetical protein